MLPELERYQQACREFEKGQMDDAVWAQALDMADGNRLAAKYVYIHLRVDSLGQEPEQQATTRSAERPKLAQVERVAIPAASGAGASTGANSEFNRAGEDAVLQAIAVKEVDSGNRNERVWKDALVLAKGDPDSARHHYICLRMDSLRVLSARAELIG